jgi:hypothetical protein
VTYKFQPVMMYETISDTTPLTAASGLEARVKSRLCLWSCMESTWRTTHSFCSCTRRA